MMMMMHQQKPTIFVPLFDAGGIDDDVIADDGSDEFRMYEFKIRRCFLGRAHDWTECPYAHAGEKARRRDPRKFHYSGTPCPEFRKGSCKRGDACDLAHGVFECWLHPSRYRTQACKDGTACRRRVCFFAHTPEQLRILPAMSPRTVLDEPPLSPMRSPGMAELAAAMRNLRLGLGFLRGMDGNFDGEEGECLVESGRALRAERYERMREREKVVGPEAADFGWVSELVK